MHCGSLAEPVEAVCVVLDDAEGVDPQVADVYASAYFDGVAEGLGEGAEADSLLEGCHCPCDEPQRLGCTPAVAQSCVVTTWTLVCCDDETNMRPASLVMNTGVPALDGNSMLADIQETCRICTMSVSLSVGQDWMHRRENSSPHVIWCKRPASVRLSSTWAGFFRRSIIGRERRRGQAAW